MNLTVLGTSLHSCQVTGSHASLPAHTCRKDCDIYNIYNSVISTISSHLLALGVRLPERDAVLLGDVPALGQHLHVGDHLAALSSQLVRQGECVTSSHIYVYTNLLANDQNHNTTAVV